MKKMTKAEFTLFARIRGFEANYSGKNGRFYLNRIAGMDINAIINSKTTQS